MDNDTCGSTRHHHFWDPTRRDYYWMGGVMRWLPSAGPSALKICGRCFWKTEWSGR